MGIGLLFILFFVAVIAGIALKIWRVVTFAKLMKISYWKAFWLLGK